MTFLRVLSAVLVPVSWAFVSVAENVPSGGSTTAPQTYETTSGGVNSTRGGGGGGGGGKARGGLFDDFGVENSMIQRALYVLIGITVIGVLYFLIRAVRSVRLVIHENLTISLIFSQNTEAKLKTHL